MTLSTTESTKVYNGNAVTDTFAFPYEWQLDIHMVITVDDVIQTLGVHYNLTGAGNPTGGSVIFTGGNIPPVGVSNVKLERILPFTQDADPQNFDGNPADSTEAVYDYLTMLIQQVNAGVLRTPKFAVGSITTSTIDEPITDNFLIWDANGNLVNGGSAADIINAEGYANAAAASAVTAGVSETNAGVSEVNAAASAAAAQAALDSAFFRDTKPLTNADSPYTMLTTDNGLFFSVDTSAGDVVINLEEISNLTLPHNMRIKKETGDANSVTINCGGTDTYGDASTVKTLQAVGGLDLIGEDDTTPDQWKTASFGASIGTMVVDNFVEGVDFDEGVDNTLTISQDAGSENNGVLSFDGLTIHHDDWSLAGTTLTYTGEATFPVGTLKIEFRFGATTPIGTPADGTVTTSKLGDLAVTFAKTNMLASVAQAQAGTANQAFMSPLRVKQAIDALTAPPKVVQSLYVETTAMTTPVGTMSADDTIPQNTEGVELLTLAITPTNAANKLRIRFEIPFAISGNNTGIAFVVQDAVANAIAARSEYCSAIHDENLLAMTFEVTAGTTSETTFKLRTGVNGGTMTVNGVGGARQYGGVQRATMIIEEIAV